MLFILLLFYYRKGTGKTHTMEGDINSESNKGIIPRSVEALFAAVAEADDKLEFTFRVSYVEIYMEKIRDLLDNTRTKKDLTVREDKQKGVYIAGVTEEYVTNHRELLDTMARGKIAVTTFIYRSIYFPFYLFDYLYVIDV